MEQFSDILEKEQVQDILKKFDISLYEFAKRLDISDVDLDKFKNNEQDYLLLNLSQINSLYKKFNISKLWFEEYKGKMIDSDVKYNANFHKFWIEFGLLFMVGLFVALICLKSSVLLALALLVVIFMQISDLKKVTKGNYKAVTFVKNNNSLVIIDKANTPTNLAFDEISQIIITKQSVSSMGGARNKYLYIANVKIITTNEYCYELCISNFNDFINNIPTGIKVKTVNEKDS